MPGEDQRMGGNNTLVMLLLLNDGTKTLYRQMKASADLEEVIRRNLEVLGYGE